MDAEKERLRSINSLFLGIVVYPLSIVLSFALVMFSSSFADYVLTGYVQTSEALILANRIDSFLIYIAPLFLIGAAFIYHRRKKYKLARRYAITLSCICILALVIDYGLIYWVR